MAVGKPHAAGHARVMPGPVFIAFYYRGTEQAVATRPRADANVGGGNSGCCRCAIWSTKGSSSVRTVPPAFMVKGMAVIRR